MMNQYYGILDNIFNDWSFNQQKKEDEKLKQLFLQNYKTIDRRLQTLDISEI